MNQVGYLYRLQRIDTQLDQAAARLSEVDQLLAWDERLVAANRAADQSKASLSKSRQNLHNLEAHVTDQQVKIEQAEASLYSGMVKNPKELQDIQKELISLRKHLGTLEDLQLQAMLDFEEAEKFDQSASEELQHVQGDVLREKAGLSGERTKLTHKMESLQMERGAALPPITPTNLDTYNKIREQKRGIAVTSLEDDACTACGAQVRPAQGQAARMQAGLTFCSSCGRILFAG